MLAFYHTLFLLHDLFFFLFSACKVGHYKNLHGNDDCVECPRNSESSLKRHVEGSRGKFCVCSPDYYRSSDESIHAPCTSKDVNFQLFAYLLMINTNSQNVAELIYVFFFFFCNEM